MDENKKTIAQTNLETPSKSLSAATQKNMQEARFVGNEPTHSLVTTKKKAGNLATSENSDQNASSSSGRHQPEVETSVSGSSRVSEDQKSRATAFQSYNQLLEDKAKSAEKINAEQLKDFETENDLIISALQLTQEKLADALNFTDELRRVLDEKSKILKKFTDTYESFTHFDDLKMAVSRDEKNIWLCHFTNILISGRLINSLQIKLDLRKETAGIVFQSSGEDHPLVRWPAGVSFEDEIACCPVMGSIALPQNQVLSILGTTDWKMLQDLIEIVTRVVSEPNESIAIAITDKTSAISKLARLQNMLQQWPVALRFDAIDVVRSTHGERYHCLELRLENPSLGNKLFPPLTYRISTVDDPEAEFGQHPRLEFPESARNVFANWYAESTDSRGKRLELRFSAPNVMDTTVWGNLSEDDKILMAALVGSAPSQMQEASLVAQGKSERWGDWRRLAAQIKTIMINNMTTTTKLAAPEGHPVAKLKAAPKKIVPSKTQSKTKVKEAYAGRAGTPLAAEVTVSRKK